MTIFPSILNNACGLIFLKDPLFPSGIFLNYSHSDAPSSLNKLTMTGSSVNEAWNKMNSVIPNMHSSPQVIFNGQEFNSTCLWYYSPHYANGLRPLGLIINVEIVSSAGDQWHNSQTHTFRSSAKKS